MEEDKRVEAEAAGADVVRRRERGDATSRQMVRPSRHARALRHEPAATGGGTLGAMGRWREAATDALATFAASRLLVLAVLLVPPTRVHSYLTTWDAGFYLSIARCGYDPACGPPVIGGAARVLPAPAAGRARRGRDRDLRRPGAARCSRRSRASRR